MFMAESLEIKRSGDFLLFKRLLVLIVNIVILIIFFVVVLIFLHSFSITIII
jgi:hypothetical protein